MVKKPSILFVYVNYSSFVKADFEILSTFANVSKYHFKPGKGIISTGIKLIRQFFFLSINIWKYNSVFVWFADYHSLMPVLFSKLLGKKSYVVIGGYEVCRIKSLNYGALCSKVRGFFCVTSMQFCSLNLTVSRYIDRKVKYIAPQSQSILIPNCVDFDLLPFNISPKKNIILTVGIIDNSRSFFLKGIDTFIEVARNCKDYEFIIIGLDKKKINSLLSNLPHNITIFGRLPHDELPAYYQSSKFYFQLSRSESFGLSVAEAMLYGCIPIVTNEGGLPELVGDKGFIVKRIPNIICQLITENSLISHDLQIEVFNRIAFCFSRVKREEKLLSLLLQTINENK